MRYVGAIALLFALVLALGAFTQLNTLQDSIISLTTGPVQSIVNTLGIFWLLIVGLVFVLALVGVGRVVADKF